MRRKTAQQEGIPVETFDLYLNGKKVTVLRNRDSARVIENDSACDYDPLGSSSSFDEITPEDVIGDGAGNRDWSQRSEREKPVWHLHVSFAGEPGVICTEVYADTEHEAGSAAIDAALVHLEVEEIWDGDDVADWLEVLRDGYHWHDLGEYCPDGCLGVRVAAI